MASDNIYRHQRDLIIVTVSLPKCSERLDLNTTRSASFAYCDQFYSIELIEPSYVRLIRVYKLFHCFLRSIDEQPIIN